MAYATVANVRDRLVRDNGDTEGNAASLPDPKIQAAIDDAQAEIDSWLSGRYDPPFADGEVPALVHTLTIDIAAYLSDLTYRQAADFSSELDPVYLRYQRALKQLEKLADGTISLPDAPEVTPDPVPNEEGFAVNKYSGDLFTPADFDMVETYDESKWVGWYSRGTC
jgi:phage gp36-like protein